MTSFTQADRDELRSQDWMRSLVLEEHDAIPVAVNPAGTLFRASCRCGYRGDLWAAGPGAKARAQKDADEHTGSGRTA